ncbi:MAG: D-2-hydroxyacid dehydrogenase [Betaproteobacteria bacterium]
MSTIVLILGLHKDISNAYKNGIEKAFPEFQVTLLDSVKKVDPFLADMEVLITHGPYLEDRADHVLTNAKKLKWIQGIGTGVDNFADRATLHPSVSVTNIHGVHGAPMSEALFGAMLTFSRQIKRSISNQQEHKWENWPSRLISGKTIGIFGLGSISKTIAPRCKAFDMKVIGVSSSVREMDGFDKIHHKDELINVVHEFDYFLILTPYSKYTHHIINAKIFSKMKPTSYLINHARGGVVDEDALIQALQNKAIAGAALDVFSKEPLGSDHPFWDMDNVFITCHQSATHDGTVNTNLPIIIKNLNQFKSGNYKDMLNLVKLGINHENS